ncbi:polypyrimidine tract-binding protein homolog 3-like isoform X3 [Juglans microcarpa x Juglans regia]|uniref:polypyrimidine tract-binding protein homolog 3-like isoform X3 n=1 Tax=Juglans microcarpa x Juglans regia TaxID=2249226 RepID=UPI001B7D9E89|nr:polypyrimidine tract-binding protein homolog 3-like isoform X3 [Juglans microcarpa x Juglans regia]
MTEPSKVLHVRNVGYEITENDLLQLVQPFGVVTKSVMLRAKNQALIQMQDVGSAVNGEKCLHSVLFTSRTDYSGSEPSRAQPGFQALIQYQSHQSALSAIDALQGRNIYDGCCQLDIQFSNLSELQVNYNNERSRDFTNPALPSEQKGRSSQSGYGDAGSMYGLQPPGTRAVAFPQVCVDQAFLLAFLFQMGDAAAITAAFSGGLPPGISGTNDRCTVLVSNLNPDKFDEDKLFNLFSLYGNIVRIKLLRSKPDHALIQMGDGFQAELAVHFLKGALLFGKQLEVNFSKYPNITPAPDTHDYSNSNLNRFNRNAAKNYRYCCSPTKMVHLSTLPQEITDDDLVTHLEEHGTIVNTKIFEANGKKQALVLFETEEQAAEALVCKHATSIDGSIIRISFSQLQTI